MELFYTVVSQEGAAQTIPSNSLGGFCSSSKVVSGDFNKMFGDVSVRSMQNPRPEYIALVLKNTSGKAAKNLKFYFDTPENSICKFRIAFVELSDSDEMESVDSIYSKPLYAEFDEATFNEPITLEGSMCPCTMLGVWVERSINVNSENVKNVNSCDALFERFKKGESAISEEEVDLIVEWEAV